MASLNLRESEQNYNKSINVNINGTTNMMSIAKELNIPFILISSGAVFSSSDSNVSFDENSIPCPGSTYGETKRAAEKIAMLYDKTIVIRTGWLFGGLQTNHYKFVETVINNLHTNTNIYAANDFFGSPTYVIDMIDKIKELIINHEYGIHHIVNDGAASGYEIACEISVILKIKHPPINSVKSIDVPNSGPDRSKSEILISTHKNNRMRTWQSALNEYVNKYIFEYVNQYILTLNSKVIQSNQTQTKKFWTNRQSCRLCNSNDLYVFYKFKPTALANQFLASPKRQEKLPLDLCICTRCSHIQLMQIVEPSMLYSNYLYISSISPVMVNHLKTSADEFIESQQLSKTDNILEIGSNDGTVVQHLLERGFVNITGIDPAKNIHARHNLPIICDFFSLENIKLFNNKKFRMIFGFHCCAHIENIQDIFKCVFELLEDDGVFIMEVGYFYEILKNSSFDVVYHEHIDYHTCKALDTFATRNGLKLYNVKETNIQGGSIQFFLSKNSGINVNASVESTLAKEEHIQLHNINNLNKFQAKVECSVKDIKLVLSSLVGAGNKIAGYGASAKSTTFLHQILSKSDYLEYIIDDNIHKHNLYSPGFHIPIKPLSALDSEHVDYILILSCNFAHQFIEKLESYRARGLRIIMPFPEFKII
jgi:dTDP-4-dehydrorhamnose reductase